MKKLVGILAGLCGLCLLFGGLTLSHETYSASAETMEDVPMATAAKIIDVYGTLQWTDDLGYTHPCKYIKVELRTGAASTYKGSVYTDEDGNYYLSCSVSKPTDVKLWVYAQSSAHIVFEWNPIKMIFSGNSLNAYIDCNIEKDVSGSVVINRNYTMDTEFGQAMQILHAAGIAARYAAEMGKIDLPQVEIWYPHPKEDMSGYAGNLIKIGCGEPKPGAPKAYASWDMIMHEYGHHVQSAYSITDYVGRVHDSRVNGIDKICKDDKNKNIENVEMGIKLAWGESWPTVFAFMAQQYFIDEISMIPTVGDAIQESFQNDSTNKADLATHVNKLGEACENSIIAILYRLYCYAPYSFGHKKMWNCVMNSNAVTFSQFLNYLIDNNYLTESQAMTLVAPYGMCPNGLGIIDNDAQLEPTLIWEGTGGSVYFPYNYFEIDIYNEAGSQLYHFKTGYTVDDEGVYRLNLNKIYWDNILRQQGGQFSFKVSAYQKRGSFKTGPYIAGKQIKKPYEDFDCSRSYGYAGKILKKPNECAWFRYVAPYSGKYRFDIGVGTESGTQTDNQATVIVFPYMAYSIGNGRIFTATGTDMTYECQLVEGQELYFYMSINQGGTGMVFARTYLIQRTQSTLSLVKNLQYNLWLPTSASEIPRFRLIP